MSVKRNRSGVPADAAKPKDIRITAPRSMIQLAILVPLWEYQRRLGQLVPVGRALRAKPADLL